MIIDFQTTIQHPNNFHAPEKAEGTTSYVVLFIRLTFRRGVTSSLKRIMRGMNDP